MPRGRAFRSATLPGLLLLAIAAVAALGFLDARDLTHRTWTEEHTVSLPVQYLKVDATCEPNAAIPPGPVATDASGCIRFLIADPPTSFRYTVQPQPHSGGVFSSGLPRARVDWLVGTSLPGVVVALGVLALIGAAVGLARRRGGYARPVLRLLRAVGFGALVGGPAAALVEYLVARDNAESGWAPLLDRWVLALVWVLIGGAFLAVGDVLARAGALRAELDEVI